MPAAAVIPAPVVYAKFVAFKMLVVELILSNFVRQVNFIYVILRKLICLNVIELYFSRK